MPSGLLHYFYCMLPGSLARQPQKILWNIKKTLRKRQKEEGSTDPSCQASPIHLGFLVASLIWVLLRRAVFSFMNEPHLSWCTKWSVLAPRGQPFSQSSGIFPAWQWMLPHRDQYLILWILPFLPLLGLLANLNFGESSVNWHLFMQSIFSPKALSFWSFYGRLWNSYIKIYYQSPVTWEMAQFKDMIKY